MNMEGFKKKPYGSLEEGERKRLKSGVPASTSITSGATISSLPTINQDNLEIINDAHRQQLIEELERKRKARTIAVSVEDSEVRKQLRDLEVPMTLFGEGPADRRERLRQMIYSMGEDVYRKRREDKLKQSQGVDTIKDEKQSEYETWYHEGSAELRKCRLFLASYSIPRSYSRLAESRRELALTESQRKEKQSDLFNSIRNFSVSSSQVGDNRPISCCSFSPDTSMIATSSWSGLCKIWSSDDLSLKRTLRGHNIHSDCIKFHPHSTISLDPQILNLASCSRDGAVFLWNLEDDEPIKSLEGHGPSRVSRLSFHPSGKYLATCCHDKSWRLWDLETCEEILFQEGHTKGVYDIAFQSDGALAASSGLDTFGRVWDLRTGRMVMLLEGHLKEVLSIDFSPDGYHIATGGEDNNIKIWNVRQRKLEYTIPAHTNIVSKVQFDKKGGKFLTSCSYDNSVKFWANTTWTPIHSVVGHDNKIMGMDLSQDNNLMVTCSYDKTFKTWTQDGLCF